MILYEDYTFVTKDFITDTHTAEYIFPNSLETKINGEGTWRIYKKSLNITYSNFTKNGEKIEKGYGFILPIKGSGLFENRLPWEIMFCRGDDDVYSIFKKVK